jgi:hypothetical protein
VGGGRYENRVPGNLNRHCFDPNKIFVLNPAVWSTPAPAKMSTGRNFLITERLKFSLRAEFTNIFNRTEMGNPSGVNPGFQIAAGGVPQAGFGYISPATVLSPPRSGTIIARFTF